MKSKIGKGINNTSTRAIYIILYISICIYIYMLCMKQTECWRETVVIYIYKLTLSGALKRTISAREVLAVSIQEWFAMPKSLFEHAWISSGYLTKDEMAAVTGNTVEDLEQEFFLL